MHIAANSFIALFPDWLRLDSIIRPLAEEIRSTIANWPKPDGFIVLSLLLSVAGVALNVISLKVVYREAEGIMEEAKTRLQTCIESRINTPRSGHRNSCR
jgi:hypothetical protein